MGGRKEVSDLDMLNAKKGKNESKNQRKKKQNKKNDAKPKENKPPSAEVKTALDSKSKTGESVPTEQSAQSPVPMDVEN